MKCQSCGTPVPKLHRKQSQLLPNIQLSLCTECRDKRLEPRWVVVLAGRSKGFEHVRAVLAERRYVGDKLYADEFA